MRRGLPAILGALVLAATGVGIFFVLAAAQDEDAEIRRVLTEFITARNTAKKLRYGDDFYVEKIFILSKTPTQAFASAGIAFAHRDPPLEVTYYDLAKTEGVWRVAKALHDDFAAFSGTPAWQDRFTRALGEQFAERWRMAVSWQRTLDFSFTIGDQEGVLRAYVSTKPFTLEQVKDDKGERLVIEMVDPKLVESGGQLKPGVVLASYREAWRYEKGTWVADGRGQLFERPK